MLLTKYHCLICGRVTDPQPEYECDSEQTLDDICDECKDAVMFAKEMKKMCEKKIPTYDETREAYICPHCKGILLYFTGPNDIGRFRINFCPDCGQAVKWE